MVKNGLLTSAIWKDFQGLYESGKEDMGSDWRAHIMFDGLKQAKRTYGYYTKCPM